MALPKIASRLRLMIRAVKVSIASGAAVGMPSGASNVARLSLSGSLIEERWFSTTVLMLQTRAAGLPTLGIAPRVNRSASTRASRGAVNELVAASQRVPARSGT